MKSTETVECGTSVDVGGCRAVTVGDGDGWDMGGLYYVQDHRISHSIFGTPVDTHLVVVFVVFVVVFVFVVFVLVVFSVVVVFFVVEDAG